MERFKTDKPGISREASAELVGPYILLAEIGRGDLATVHLAKKHGALGFQRLYALKRLKPALATSLEHIELLLDEARLVSGIHHANIAGVLDVGTDAGSYVVMEYIEGENLENLLARAGAGRHPRYVVPPLVDTLHGLHALHTAVDDATQSCSIVHQAPRARHVLLGIDGTARLIDFSQVRAHNVRQSRCRSDRLKVAYMAPEMALHPDGVDVRADLFVVGITLWEALTGERLFAGDNDDQTFQNMLHRRIPRPSEVGLKPPRCFDAICMRALERDRTKRYVSALEMARDLRDTALNQALYATSAELGQWVREHAGKELRERRRLSGTETPSSSGGISLETPPVGVEHNAMAKAVARAPSELSARGVPTATAVDDGAHVSSRMLGASRAQASFEAREDAAKTPAVGMRRGALPLRREETGDDEPTGRRSSLPDTARPAAPSPRSSPAAPQNEDVGRAATLPIIGHATPTLVRAVAERGSPVPGSEPEPSQDHDATQPNAFVPARPGARRDTKVASPGAYSQVDARRGRTASERPSPSAAVAGSFEEVATTQRPSVLPQAASAQCATSQERSSAPAAPSRPNAAAAPQSSRRPAVITETPPTYVQRRDSNPTRMQMPDGPVGVPHRAFPTDDMNSDVRGLDEPLRDRSQPRVRAPEMQSGLHVGMVDSLTPSNTAAQTAPPEEAEPEGRGWAMWLASGVLAAIILLAVGVGVRQWIAGPNRPLPSTRHSAHGAASDESFGAAQHEPPAAAPAPATAPLAPATAVQPPPLPADAAAAGQVQTPPAGPAPVQSGTAIKSPPKLRAAPRQPGSFEAAPRRAQPGRSKMTGGLPENPY